MGSAVPAPLLRVSRHPEATESRSRCRLSRSAVNHLEGRHLIRDGVIDNETPISEKEAAALIELGFLLAYRTGWRISIAAVATNAAAAVVLIPVGLFVFKDHLSLRNVIGLIFCIVGLALVVRQ